VSAPSQSWFLGTERLRFGPWQAFERDFARLFLANGFADVRMIGGSGDRGADVLAVRDKKLWVVQCKHTTSGPPPIAAIDEVIEAGRVYGAHKLVVAVSRPPSPAFAARIERERSQGLDIEIADPRMLLGWAANTPEYSIHARELHRYQSDTVEKLTSALKDTGRGQVVLATGLGKTVILAETASSLLRDNKVRNGLILVLAHTTDLVNQLIRSFWYQLPSWVHTHRLAQGEEPTYWRGIVFATVQTVVNRLGSLPEFGLVMVDEAHHIGAASFQQVIQSLKPPMVAGVTATPWRGDGYDIDHLLGEPLVKIGIAEGLQQGFLSEVDYRLLADNLDWKFIQEASVYKYSLTQLNKRLIIPIRDEEAGRIIADTFIKSRRRGGIAYCPSGTHAKEFAGTLRQFGLTVEPILFDTPPREREMLLSKFRAGAIQIVTTVDLFNEGIDVPDVDLIVFMRATHSRRIFVQQLGRGLRTSPGKDKVIVLDFVTDLRRVAEAVQLDTAAKGGIERLGLGPSLISFSDRSAGSFLQEWVLDQASLMLREGDPQLELPKLNFPPT
jgi:superfamily II DNA or RNA helicase/Holliday junction resolvase